MRFINLVLLFICLVAPFIAIAQNKNFLEEGKPITPSASQFLKYTEVPVSDYTGIPNISIPLYNINEDGLNVPIELNYHSGGIRVNEEAGYVGLGWSMQIGSIVQIVNDVDDLNPINTKHKLDYIGSPMPSELPLRYPAWPVEIEAGTPNKLPVYTTLPDYTFPIATQYYFPVDGDYNTNLSNVLAGSYSDTEPDIFKANFLNHSINFIFDRKNNNKIVVLNKQGYLVEYLTDKTWRITVPNGDKFYFKLRNASSSTYYSLTKTSTNTYGNGGGASLTASSCIWMLTNITTKNNEENLNIEYNVSSSFPAFPSLSQTWKKARELTSYRRYSNNVGFRAFQDLPPAYETSMNWLKDLSITLVKITVVRIHANRY